MNLQRFLINPFIIFLSIWFIIYLSFQIKISYFFDDFGIFEILIPIICIIFFSLGFFIFYLIKLNVKSINKTKIILLNRKRLNLFVKILLIFSLLIIFFNIIFYGAPPFISILEGKNSNYLQYGKFKNLLFANAIFLFFISIFLKRPWSLFVKIFAFTILILYISRGNVVFMLIFYLFFILHINYFNNLKLVKIFFIIVLFILLMFQIIGEFRTGTDVFYNVMEIKEEFRIKNSGLIWIISYISMPYDNFLTFFKHNTHLFLGENIISRSLPAFLEFNKDVKIFYKTLLPNQYNTVSTYLIWIYLDFGLVGIILFNFIIGIISGFLFFFKKDPLINSLWLTLLFLIFFSDYFFYFMSITLWVYIFIFKMFVIEREFSV